MSVYTLDGVALDDPAGRWYLNAKTGLRIVPGRASRGLSLPGRDGTTPSLGSSFTAGAVPIRLTVRRPTHGDVMGALEFLHGLLSQRHRLLPLVHDYGNGQTRTAMVEVLGVSDHEMLMPKFVRLDVVCEVPGVFWRDPATADAVVPVTASSATTTLTALAGTTGGINDALIQIKGALSSVTITDPVSGDRVTYNAALTATQYAVIDTANWVGRRHTSASWSTTTGTNVITSVVSNRGAGPILTLNPDFTTGAGRLRITVAGTNPATSPTVTVRAKRSFL